VPLGEYILQIESALQSTAACTAAVTFESIAILTRYIPIVCGSHHARCKFHQPARPAIEHGGSDLRLSQSAAA
jgi:hypothetical protein